MSEYAKWMEGAGDALSGPEEAINQGDRASPEALLDEVLNACENRPSTMWGKIKQAFNDTWMTLTGRSRTTAERELDAAEQVSCETHDKLSETRSRVKGIEERLNGTMSQEVSGYASLEGQCLSTKVGEYKYELCFFKSAKQDSTSLGTWSRWENPHLAVFDGGQYCPGGPTRSIRVSFSCGPRAELVDVSEPSRCSYAATVTHPGACTEALLEELQANNPRRPMDEL